MQAGTRSFNSICTLKLMLENRAKIDDGVLSITQY